MNNNMLHNMPRFTNNGQLKDLLIEAEENKIENIEEFTEGVRQFEKLVRLQLKITDNKLTLIPRILNK